MCGCFQKAAAIFLYLKEYVVSEGLVGLTTSDLNPDSLELFHLLMLGQAQECMYTKSVLTKMKNDLVARLAAQVAVYYEQTFTLINGESLKDAFDTTWQSMLHLRMEVFRSLVHYRMALCAGDVLPIQDIKEQLGRLQASAGHLASCANLAESESDRKYIDGLSQVVGSALSKADDENQKLFHENPTAPEALAAVVPKVLAKVMALDYKSELGDLQDPFKNLTPAHLHRAIQCHKDRVPILNKSLTLTLTPTLTPKGSCPHSH